MDVHRRRQKPGGRGKQRESTRVNRADQHRRRQKPGGRGKQRESTRVNRADQVKPETESR